MRDISARELKGHNILAVERFQDTQNKNVNGLPRLLIFKNKEFLDNRKHRLSN